jgi:hypothetical protein
VTVDHAVAPTAVQPIAPAHVGGTEVHMSSTPSTATGLAMRTPRAAAVAGIVFSVLFAASVVLLEWAIPSGSQDAGTWVEEDARRNAVTLSLQLLPFAGIAFLWFIGVLRDRIGSGEDRFFATVFLGSGLLFVAMFFVSGAVAGGLISTAAEASAGRLGSVWPFGRRSAASLAAVYGLRMAAVFTISATTLATRLQVIPRWLTVLGYVTAAVLLLGVGLVPWLQVVFPGWVFVLSVHLLVVTFRHGDPSSPATNDDTNARRS